MALYKGTLISVATALVLGATLVVAGWEPDPDEPLPNEVHFPISCSAASQGQFDHAVSLLHSLHYAHAERAFAAIAADEPACAMAYWGMAMSRLKRPISAPPSSEDVRIANEAIRVGSGAATASPRERAYVEAVGGLVAEGILPDWHDRTLAYEQAMGAIFQRYPEDREAAIFYALALNMATRPSDRSYAKQTRATELLLVALGDQPNHPGIIHYLTYCVGDASAVARDATPSQGIGMSTRTRRILLIGLAPLLIGGVSWLALLGSAWAAESAAAPIGGPFTLKSGGGQTVSDRDFRGKWLLVYFGYTQCPDVCPTTLAEIAQTLQKLGPLAAEVQPIFITIDPERDTPEAVREYVEAFDPRLVGLTGTPGEIATVAKEYRVYYKRQAGKNAADYLMEHSAFVYVIDPAGKYATLFAPRGGQGPDQMAQRLRELIAQGPRH